ncbi:MAG: penicillin-binding protein 2 [Chloroflexi bacterium]|nr:penicillin-binding protein 2 [Chloroflexota bacterium]
MTVKTRLTGFQNWRNLVVYSLLASVAVIFVARLFNLQILNGKNYALQAESLRTETISVAAPRGIIYDRNGILLARNTASYSIVITPASLPDDDGDIQRIYRDLSALTGVPVNHGTVDEAKLLQACTPGPGITQLVDLGISNAPYDPVKIQCYVDEQTAMVVREHEVEWSGVSVEIEPMRDYPTGSLTATIVGFLGPIPASLEQEYRAQGFLPNRDKVGYAGVEYSMNDTLIGTPGERTVEVDVAGQVLSNLAAPVAPVPGNNIVLTIDTRLQQAASTILKRDIDYWNNDFYKKYQISSGVVIAMNPKTGEILAMAQYPTYENNRMARIIPAYYYRQLEQDPAHPLLNFAINTEYSPGSTFKISTATGALNEGVVTPSTVIDAPAMIGLQNTFSPTDPGHIEYYYDWTYTFYGETSGLGKISFLMCIARSSDVCFYKVGGGYAGEVDQGLGIYRLQQYAQALGYNQPSGIELPGELSGLIPDPAWKRIYQGENWSTGDTYLASVGQGYVLATPLQVLMSLATIANDGRLMQPTIIHDILDGEGNVIQPFTPRLRWDITTDPVIKDFNCVNGECNPTGKMKTVSPAAVQEVQAGMRLAATDPAGTLNHDFQPYTSFKNYPIAIAGKTGTAEYCDDVANAKGMCIRGEWPAHGWTVAYAPYDNPEIAILVFLYNAGEGGRVAAPTVKAVMDAYFEIKAVDTAQGLTGNP